MTLLFWIACAAEPSAQIYLRALQANDGPTGWAICAELSTAPLRSDCQSAVAARTGWFARCGEVESAPWRDECWFEAAERQARSGDYAGALDACGRSAFDAECQDHILGSLAGALVALPVVEVTEQYAAIETHVRESHERPRLLFWRHYQRNRIRLGLPVGSADCADPDCRGAARVEVSAATAFRVARDPTACGTLPGFSWDADEGTHELVLAAQAKACAAKGGRPRR